ncbi:hypothetical protein JCM3775_003021 [Rhodotorula graminis]|uniref:Ig-like domain-containing protein n=1 Tax=Rhodotorula graminis (strain WP1) TaxID=578459 RepID=A0A194S7S7_RHOGW|nr:uncharacterized protein RHOBADRAFT_42958 [Rhodotorula graminis WP1]KPV76614.1 hypothetical protein RHOBADRAFT_42958 [Rhodotorula graminis WP1]
MHLLVPFALGVASATALPTLLVHRQLPSLSLVYDASTFSPTGQGVTYRSTLNYSCDALSFSYAGSRPPLSLTAHRANDSSLLTVIGSFYATSGNVSWAPTLPEGERYFVRLEDSEGKTSDTNSSLIAVPQRELSGCTAYYSGSRSSSGMTSVTAGLIIVFAILAVPLVLALFWVLARLYRLMRRFCCPAAHARSLARLAAKGVARTTSYARSDSMRSTDTRSSSFDEKMAQPMPPQSQPARAPPEPPLQPLPQPLAEARARYGSDGGERRLSRVSEEPSRRQSLAPAEIHRLELHVDELQRALRAAAALAEREGEAEAEAEDEAQRSAGQQMGESLPRYHTEEDIVDWDSKSEK